MNLSATYSPTLFRTRAKNSIPGTDVSPPLHFTPSAQFAGDFARQSQNFLFGGYQVSTYSRSDRMPLSMFAFLMICSPILVSLRRWHEGRTGMGWESKPSMQSQM